MKCLLAIHVSSVDFDITDVGWLKFSCSWLQAKVELLEVCNMYNV